MRDAVYQEVISADSNERQVKVTDYQTKITEHVTFKNEGKRSIVATMTKHAQFALTV